MEVKRSSTSELTSSSPLDFVLLEGLPDLNVEPIETCQQLESLVPLADTDDDRPRSSSTVEYSLVLSDLNDESRNRSVISHDLFPNLNDEQTNNSVHSVELNHEPRNPRVVTLDLFPSSKEDDKEDRSTKQSLAITTNNVVSCCSSTSTEVQEETVATATAPAPAPAPESNDTILPTIMDVDIGPLHVPSVSIKRKPVDIDYSSPHDPNPKAPKRKKKAAPCTCDHRKKALSRFAPYPDEKYTAIDKTLCRNMKMSILLTVRYPKDVGSLGDIEELAEELLQKLDIERLKENRQRGPQPIHLVSEQDDHVVVIQKCIRTMQA